LPQVAAAQKTGVLWRLADALGRLGTTPHRSSSSSSSGGNGLPPGLQAHAAGLLLQAAAQASPRAGVAAAPEAVATAVAAQGVYALLAPTLPGQSAPVGDTGGDTGGEERSSGGGYAGGKARLKLDVPGARTVAALLKLQALVSFPDAAAAAAAGAIADGALGATASVGPGDGASATVLLSALRPLAPLPAPGTAKDFRRPKELALPAEGASVRACVALAVARLPPALLAALAVDSLGSKCVLQPALEAGTRDSGSGGSGTGGSRGGSGDGEGTLLAEARRRLVAVGLKGQWAAVAADAVGQHTLRVAFRCADAAGKECIAAELAPFAHSKLLGSSAGRASLQLVGVDAYVRRKGEWLAQVRKADGSKADGSAQQLHTPGASWAGGAPGAKRPAPAVAAALAAAEAAAAARRANSGGGGGGGGGGAKAQAPWAGAAAAAEGSGGAAGGKVRVGAGKPNKRSQNRMDKVLDIKKRGSGSEATAMAALGFGAEPEAGAASKQPSKRPHSGNAGEEEKPKKRKETKKSREGV
jgi:hypothetical protein